MNPESIQTIIITKFVFSLNGHITYRGSQNSEYHCSVWLYHTGSWGYSYESCKYPAGKSEGSCFSLMEAFNYNPRQGTGSGGNLGCSQSLGGA